MSELTFTLLRLGYLVLLWMFVLTAVAVLRRDLAARGSVRADRKRQAQGAAQPRAGTAAPAPAAASPSTGPTRLVVHARARRRLLLVAARPDLPAGSLVVRRGPRLDQRHVHRRPADLGAGP